MNQTLKHMTRIVVGIALVVAGVSGADAAVDVNTLNTGLRVIDHSGNPLNGVAVDLLRANGSSTGLSARTANDGLVGFEVLPHVNVRFNISYNGATETSEIVASGQVIDFQLTGQVTSVGLVLVNSDGRPIQGVRVDLLSSGGSNTGVQVNTDRSGIAEFETMRSVSNKLRVYHNGGSFVTGIVPHGKRLRVQTLESSLELLNSAGKAISGQRVNLLLSNGSNSGVRGTTDKDGVARFEILPAYAHAFKVYHHGGSYITETLTYGEDVQVRTHVSKLVLSDSEGDGIEDVRVDLLRKNNSNTKIRSTTDASGFASFETLPGFVHRFRTYYGGGRYTTASTIDQDVFVSTEITEVRLVDVNGNGIAGRRVNVLRSNNSNTGLKTKTDKLGWARFQVLPDFSHKFRVYYHGGTQITPELASSGSQTVKTVVTRLTLLDHAETGIEKQRVDLIRKNGSSTGLKANTDKDGVAAFEVLGDFLHKFKVHFNGATEVTAEVKTGAEHDLIQTALSTVTVMVNDTPLADTRVDLLRENNSTTGQRLNTDDNGQAAFEVLATFVHNFRARVGNAWESTDAPVVAGDNPTISVTGVSTKLALSKAALGSDHDLGVAYEFGLEQNIPIRLIP